MLLNIDFSDGNKLISYDDYSCHYDGCDTCDYGSEYINDIVVQTTNYTIMANFNQMYDYAFSTGQAIKIFAVGITTMTEKEFVEYVEKELRAISSHALRVLNIVERS